MFWSKVGIKSKDQCWLWRNGINNIRGKNRYGSFYVSAEKRGYRTHRVAYFYHYKKDPLQLLVCHKCDNPLCCNPHHLFLGTHHDNEQDCLRKNRANKERGQNRYNAVLKESDIRFIRSKFWERGKMPGTLSGIQLSKKFGVGGTMISAIVNFKRWKHVV